MRFRSYAIALTFYIEKGFHRVNVHKKDREFLSFLRFDIFFSGKPKIVSSRFVRVIFGITCLPFLINEAIRKHDKKCEFDIIDIFGIISHFDFVHKILDCFCVDVSTGDEGDFYKALALRFLTDIFIYANGDLMFQNYARISRRIFLSLCNLKKFL